MTRTRSRRADEDNLTITPAQAELAASRDAKIAAFVRAGINTTFEREKRKLAIYPKPVVDPGGSRTASRWSQADKNLLWYFRRETYPEIAHSELGKLFGRTAQACRLTLHHLLEQVREKLTPDELAKSSPATEESAAFQPESQATSTATTGPRPRKRRRKMTTAQETEEEKETTEHAQRLLRAVDEDNPPVDDDETPAGDAEVRVKEEAPPAGGGVATGSAYVPYPRRPLATGFQPINGGASWGTLTMQGPFNACSSGSTASTSATSSAAASSGGRSSNEEEESEMISVEALYLLRQGYKRNKMSIRNILN